MVSFIFSLLYFPENPAQIGKGYVSISILDINDNAPEFAMEYETNVCENASPGQVSVYEVFCITFVIKLKLLNLVWIARGKLSGMDHNRLAVSKVLCMDIKPQSKISPTSPSFKQD